MNVSVCLSVCLSVCHLALSDQFSGYIVYNCHVVGYHQQGVAQTPACMYMYICDFAKICIYTWTFEHYVHACTYTYTYAYVSARPLLLIHCSLHPNLYVGAHEGSAMHQKWYYEAEITQIPAQHADEHFHIRIGWAHTTLFRSRPSSNSFLTTSGGIGDDLYSIAFDGEYFWFGGESFQSRPGKRKLQRQEMLSDSPTPSRSSMPHGTICVGDVIGCHLDLSAQEVWFTKNGRAVPGRLHYSHLDDMITPAISVSNSVRYCTLSVKF